MKPEFTTGDIPWPQGIDKILLDVSKYRHQGKSLAGSVAHSILQEGYALEKNTLALLPQRSIEEVIKSASIATTIGSYYAKPSFHLLRGEELLRTGDTSPSVKLPEEALADEFMAFCRGEISPLKPSTQDDLLKTEARLTVIKADLVINDARIAAELPGKEPEEFVNFAMIEEVRILNAQGLSPVMHQIRQEALLNGAQRFSEIYKYASLLE